MPDRIWYIAKSYIICGILIAALLCIVFFSIHLNRDEAKKQVDLGEKSYSAQKYEKAVTHYTDAIAHSPHLIKAYVGLARSYIALDEYGKAEEILLESIETDPNTSSPYIMLAELYQSHNETEKLSKLILQMEKVGLNSWASAYAEYESEDTLEVSVQDDEMIDIPTEHIKSVPTTEKETTSATASPVVDETEESTAETSTEPIVTEAPTEAKTIAQPTTTQARTQPPATTEVPTTTQPRTQPQTTTEAPTEPVSTEPFIETSEMTESFSYSDEFMN